MPEHSPEPWVHSKWDYSDCVVTGPIVDANNMCVVGSGPAATVEDFDRIVACVNALRGLNPEVVPELVDCLKSLYNSHQELLERCLLHDAFLNHAQQLGAGADAIRAKELLARVRA
jgi:hypothetical protein